MSSVKPSKPFSLCLLILALLGVLSLIPPFNNGSFSYRQIDLLSDVRPAHQSPAVTTAFPDDTVDVVKPTAIPKHTSASAERKSSPCGPGIICIEDFSPEQNGVERFSEALSDLKNKRVDKPLRIAFFGDSFIEGDVLCGSFRDTLQTLFGGRGVGFVPITSNTVGFRNTIRQSFNYWKTYSIISKPDLSETYELGPAGYCFLPEEGNWVEFKVSRQRYLREFSVMRLYYKSMKDVSLVYTINDTLTDVSSLKKSSALREWKIESPRAKQVQFQFENPEGVQVYGASFEGQNGVYVDNFAMRGNSGISLDNIGDAMFQNFNRYRDYKLILLQYGLNVLYTDSARFSWYADRMITVIEKLKNVFPDASIVLISVSDRSTNVNGTYKTAGSIRQLRNTQRYIAKKTQIAFWDLFEAMGGENSMVRFVSATPALAAKDYTHLTFRGGKKLAGHLAGSLLHEVKKYEQQEQEVQ
jgi:hypothetical protein